ncbi:PKCB1 protein, partial [Ploceus nigricollis]|nr:PKCB1 protein [Ploceus nigricollis]
KITVAECIETQSKAMTMLTIEQLSYLLKFALQKMKQPGTEPFQKPVSLDQHPDYAEYIFHPMDLCTLEKNVKKKMYGCTEAFLADAKWILHNCIIYNGDHTANPSLKECVSGGRAATGYKKEHLKIIKCYIEKKVLMFCICKHVVHAYVFIYSAITIFLVKAFYCFLRKSQIDTNSKSHHQNLSIIFVGFLTFRYAYPWPTEWHLAKALLMSLPLGYSLFIIKTCGEGKEEEKVDIWILLKGTSAGTAKTDKQEKIKLNFDMTASPKILMSKSMLSSSTGRRISLTDMPRSPMSTNSSVHTGSDVEQDAEKKATSSHFSASEESMDFIEKNTASPAPTRTGQAGSLSGSPKPFSPQASTPISAKQERTSTPGSILNLNL